MHFIITYTSPCHMLYVLHVVVLYVYCIALAMLFHSHANKACLFERSG